MGILEKATVLIFQLGSALVITHNCSAPHEHFISCFLPSFALRSLFCPVMSMKLIKSNFMTILGQH